MFRAPALPRTLDAALRDVSSTKAAVRADAVRDLVRHAEDARSQVVRALERALGDDAAPVRSAAALGLADVGAHEALSALLIAIEDDDVHVRQMALTALGEIGDSRAAPRLARALDDPRAEVRFQAVIAYARAEKDRASVVEALAARTRDADPLVCHIALRMAEELGGEDDHVVDPLLVARARVLLDHEAATVRVAAAVILGRAGDHAGAKVLASLVSGKLRTDDAEDEAAAIELAGTLGLSETRPGLERRAFGRAFGLGRDRFSWHARVALAILGHERAQREIVAELGAWDRNKRTLAVAAVGRARIHAARPILAAMQGDPARADQDAVREALDLLAKDEPS